MNVACDVMVATKSFLRFCGQVVDVIVHIVRPFLLENCWTVHECETIQNETNNQTPTHRLEETQSVAMHSPRDWRD